MTIDQAIERIQFAYPQIYHACHTRHERKRSTPFHVSARDGAMLVHLDRAVPITVSELAGHLDLAASTVSEAISKLETYGYVLKAGGRGHDRRRVRIMLTPKGAEAVRATSVLESARLRAVLARMTTRDRARVIDGLARLAEACRQARSKRRR